MWDKITQTLIGTHNSHNEAKKEIETLLKDSDIPDTETMIQSQSAVLFKGTESELQQFMSNVWFDDICMGFFHQAAKNHYYGFNRLHYLYVTPVYKDFNRTTDEFNHCFMGFLIKQGHYDYMPGKKKIWYD